MPFNYLGKLVTLRYPMVDDIAEHIIQLGSGYLLKCNLKRAYLTIILRNRAEYRLILSRRGRRPSRLKSDDIPRD